MVLEITGCSSPETSSTYVLPPGLEKAARQEALQFFTATGLDGLRLDTVTELTITDIRHPLASPAAPSARGYSEMWCFTTVARGTVANAPDEVSLQWFGFKQQGEDWEIIPRHIVAYLSLWDDLCDEAQRLDK
jgi:hypothetical protein